MFSPEALRENLFFQLLGAAGIPLLAVASPQFLPLSSLLLLLFYVCIMFLCISLTRTLVVAFRAQPDDPGKVISHPKILSLITSAKTFFQDKGTFTGSGDWDVDTPLGAIIRLPK